MWANISLNQIATTYNCSYKAFAETGTITIKSKMIGVRDEELGQSNELTEWDRAKIIRMYGCGKGKNLTK